jgi:hypothetical protein
MKPHIAKAASRGWIDGFCPWVKSMVKSIVTVRRTLASTAARGHRCTTVSDDMKKADLVMHLVTRFTRIPQ